jgi:uncharacterized membrane protein YadS
MTNPAQALFTASASKLFFVTHILFFTYIYSHISPQQQKQQHHQHRYQREKQSAHPTINRFVSAFQFIIFF